MAIITVLIHISALDMMTFLLGAAAVLRLATAAIGFVVAAHRGIRYFRSRSK